MKTPRAKPIFLRYLMVHRACQVHLLFYTVMSMLLTAAYFVILNLQSQTEGEGSNSYWMVILLGFISFVFIFYGGLWLSNKIVGPIYSLNRHMTALLNGDKVPELQIRSTDYFRETMELYNQLVKKLQEHPETAAHNQDETRVS